MRDFRYGRVVSNTYEEFRRAHLMGTCVDFITFPKEKLKEFERKAFQDLKRDREGAFLWAYFATYDRPVNSTVPYALMEFFRFGFLYHDPEPLYMLGVFYMDGYGLRASPECACDLFRQAADGGLLTARYQLGICKFHGIGTAQDLADARYQFKLARGLNDPDVDCYLAAIDLLTAESREKRIKAYWDLVRSADSGSTLASRIVKGSMGEHIELSLREREGILGISRKLEEIEAI